MKKLSLFTIALSALFFTACEEGAFFNEDEITTEDQVAANELAAYDAISETVVIASYEEIDESTDLIIDAFFNTGANSAGRLERHGYDKGNGEAYAGENPEHLQMACAEVTRDTTTHTITVDFGEGCTDAKGILKSGKIIIQYEGLPRNPGSYRTITFEDFFMDSIQIEGVRTVANITDTANTDNMEVRQITLEGGKMTFPDGTYITRDAAHIRTLYRGESREESYITLTGSAAGQLQDSTTYTATILEEILISGDCNLRVPVSGIKEFVAGDNTITIDFGDGTCDNLAEVTTNGETETIELKTRREFNDGNRDGRDRPRHGRHHGNG